MQFNHYFEHDADIGIIGYGDSIDHCFADAAKSMFALIADLDVVNPMIPVSIEFVEEDVELAFVTWLNQLIAKAQANNLILSQFQIEHIDNHWQGEGRGEVWRDDIEPGIDVKGATLTMLSVKKINMKWEAKCVVDV